jgi:MYXO-CTERM domain-containing protein
MGIVNKRNAVVGWAVLKVGKRVAKKKARDVIPGKVEESRRPNKSAIAVALAGVGGAVMFRRRRGRGAAEAE